MLCQIKGGSQCGFDTQADDLASCHEVGCLEGLLLAARLGHEE